MDIITELIIVVVILGAFLGSGWYLTFKVKDHDFTETSKGDGAGVLASYAVTLIIAVSVLSYIAAVDIVRYGG